MKSPLKHDPSRTLTIRRQFQAETNRRFRKFRGEVNELVIGEDAFGLQKPKRIIANTRWKFENDKTKIAKFRKWLKERVDAGILEVGSGFIEQPWTDRYIESAYKKGVIRSYLETHQGELKKDISFLEGSRAQFLTDAFDHGELTSKLELVATRAFDQLQDITSQMSQQISRELVDGLSRGDGPRSIARRINATAGTITKRRALTLARTETVYAHAEGQLDSFVLLGVEDVGILAEWLTAGDDRVCPQCAALSGIVIKVKKARGLIPRHPNCRCAFTAALKGLEEKGQKWSRKSVDKAIKKSIQSESPKLSGKKARKRSRWVGADL